MNLYDLVIWGETKGYTPLFEEIEIYEKIDKNVLSDRIIYNNWDLEPRITDYGLFKKMIDNFFKVKYNTYKRIYDSLEEEYDPLHNFNRMEVKKETRNTATIDINSRTNNVDTVDISIENGSSNTGATGSTEHKVSAYNSTSYQPSNADIATSNSNNTIKNTIDKTKTEETKETEDKDRNVEDNYNTDNHLYGNIGVTTSQKMLEDEIKLRSNYNVYDIIALDFRREFMLLSL